MRAVFFQVFRIGEKNALASGSRLGIEKPVDGVETQIGHRRVIAVGKSKGDGESFVRPGSERKGLLGIYPVFLPQGAVWLFQSAWLAS